MRIIIPSYREILTYMRKNNLSEICLDRYRGYHNLEDNNLVYDELQADRASSGSPIVKKDIKTGLILFLFAQKGYF